MDLGAFDGSSLVERDIFTKACALRIQQRESCMAAAEVIIDCLLDTPPVTVTVTVARGTWSEFFKPIGIWKHAVGEDLREVSK